MNSLFKILICFLLVAISGSIGFYLGFQKGAKTIGSLASQNEISSALSRINASLIALEKNDLAYSQQQHQRNFSSGLFDLGSYTKAVPYWKCKDRDRLIVSNARNYINQHLDMDRLPSQPLLGNALQFCQDAK